MSCPGPMTCPCGCHNGYQRPCTITGGCGLNQRTQGRPKATTDHPRRRLLADFGVIVDELFGEVTTREKVPPTATPGYRPPTDGRPVPKVVDWRTRELGLITQLEHAAGIRPAAPSTPRASIDGARTDFVSTALRLGATIDEAARMVEGYGTRPVPSLTTAGPARGTHYGADITTHTKPGSRPPASLDAIDTLTTIEAAALQLRRDADRAAHITSLPRARGLRGEVRHLTWLLETGRDGQPLLTDRWGQRIYQAARGWAADARVALSYLAPIVTLEVRCPDCGGEMRVRQDATSDVWCVGGWIVEGPALEDARTPVRYRCGAVWPRITWVQLLDTTNRESSA